MCKHRVTSGTSPNHSCRQTKQAMSTILADLREGDHFNIITFSDQVRTWKRGRTVRATRQNVRDAKEFVRRIIAEGCESKVMEPNPTLSFILEEKTTTTVSFCLNVLSLPHQGPISMQLYFQLPSSSTRRPLPDISHPIVFLWSFSSPMARRPWGSQLVKPS